MTKQTKTTIPRLVKTQSWDDISAGLVQKAAAFDALPEEEKAVILARNAETMARYRDRRRK
jgi:hypothetical protein